MRAVYLCSNFARKTGDILKPKKTYYLHFIITIAILAGFCNAFATVRYFHLTKNNLHSQVYILTEEKPANADISTGHSPFDFSKIDKDIWTDWRNTKKVAISFGQELQHLRLALLSPINPILVLKPIRLSDYPPKKDAFYVKKCPIRT